MECGGEWGVGVWWSVEWGGVVRCGGVVGCGGEWSVGVWWGVEVSGVWGCGGM